jgi:cardiolipin synthase C
MVDTHMQRVVAIALGRAGQRDQAPLAIGLRCSAFVDSSKVDKMTSIGFRPLALATLMIITFWMGTCADGSSVKLLHSEVEAFQLRLEMIEAAQSTIDLSSYEISDDNTSGRIFVALLHAVERGVAVRVLVDGHIGSNRMPKPMMQFLIEHKIAIRERPVDVRYQLELGRARLHDKLLIVDRTRLITGGRNQVQVHFGLGGRKCVDRDVYVEGQSACHASDYFEKRWTESRTGQPNLVRTEDSKMLAFQVHKEWNAIPRSQALDQVATWLAKLPDDPIPARNLCGSAIHYDALDIDESNLNFLHDMVCDSKRANGAIAPVILRLLRQAARTIEIETPYFAISSDLKSILLDAAHRGVQIRVLTNSLEATDHPTVHAGFANERRWMLKAGIKIYEYPGPNMIHAKSMVIDGRIAMVGSYNFDQLSEKRNAEVALVVTDPVFANQVSTSISAHRSQATELHRGDLFRYEARESNVPTEDLRRFQRLRIAAPFIERYL